MKFLFEILEFKIRISNSKILYKYQNNLILSINKIIKLDFYI